MMFYKETDFQDTEIGKIPYDWKKVKLNEILEEVDVRVGNKEDLKRATVLSLTKNYGLVLQANRFEKRVATEDVSDYKIIRRGWLVYNPYVIWEGAIHFLKDLDLGLVSPVYLVWKTNAEADYLFLDYLVRTKKMLNAFFRLSTGAVQRRRAIKKASFLEISIPLPPLSEQKMIAEVLGVVDSAVGLVDRVILKTERLKKGLMQTLLTRGIGHKEYKQTPIGTIPKEWEVAKLKELGELQYGYTTSAKQEDTGVKFLRITDIQEDGSVDWEQVPYCHIEDDEFNKYALHKGDLLFARIGATAGKTTYIDHDIKGIFASYLIRLKIIKENIHPHFVFYFTQSAAYWSQALRQREGQLKKGINATMLSDFIVPLPPFEEQQKIAEILFSIDQKLSLERREKARLERVKQSLMDLLLTGKIRVKVD